MKLILTNLFDDFQHKKERDLINMRSQVLKIRKKDAKSVAQKLISENFISKFTTLAKQIVSDYKTFANDVKGIKQIFKSNTSIMKKLGDWGISGLNKAIDEIDDLLADKKNNINDVLEELDDIDRAYSDLLYDAKIKK